MEHGAPPEAPPLPVAEPPPAPVAEPPPPPAAQANAGPPIVLDDEPQQNIDRNLQHKNVVCCFIYFRFILSLPRLISLDRNVP